LAYADAFFIWIKTKHKQEKSGKLAFVINMEPESIMIKIAKEMLTMKGYKALDMDMKAKHGNGMQYEMGKWYTIEGKVVPCENGYHFCETIEEINGYCSIKDSRLFEIEADGKIVRHNNKYAAEKIRLVRELTKGEIYDYFKQNQEKFLKSKDSYVRKAVAEQGCGLDTLVNDENDWVRMAVAEQGYGLDVLINDEDFFVRITVAEQGYDLNVLVRDKSRHVRHAVAKQGYGLDILISDKDPDIRREVAKQGYGLDVLINDEDYLVRATVASKGYGLNILINDADSFVKEIAQEMLKQQQ